jgi:UDP-N-acetylglucosamine 2-epimerase (non-hydrolysing)
MTPSIAIVIGTRPEAIKLTPVIQRLRAAAWPRVVVLPSGQHGDELLRVLGECQLEYDGMPPPPGVATPDELVAHLTKGLQARLASHKPDFVLVHGDTASAMAGALAATSLDIRLGHVEAGLRTYDLQHPYPEESYRQAIARLARLHFAPTEAAAANLRREGVPPKTIFVTGNTIVDRIRQLRVDDASDTPTEAFLLATLHRRELAPFLDDVVEGLGRVLAARPEFRILMPAHPSPTISQPLRRTLGRHPRVKIVPPLPHLAFLDLMRRAAVVITDSGGVQEEAAVLGAPLVVVRRTTERPEAVQDGRAIIAGFGPAEIAAAVDVAIRSPRGLGSVALGDGYAAARIVQILKRELGNDAPRAGDLIECPARSGGGQDSLACPPNPRTTR